MDRITLTPPQKRWLAVATIAALLAGIIFLRPYLSVIVVSAIAAYLFYPVYRRFNAKFNRPSLSAALTLIISLLTIIIPFCLMVLLTVWQTEKLLTDLDSAQLANDINAALPQFIETINHLLNSWGISFQLTTDQLAEAARHTLETVGKHVLAVLGGSIGSFFSFFTLLILYMFVFTNMLSHQAEVLSTIGKLNILGGDLGRLYSKKIGAMTKATVRGQFIIATVQGLASAVGLYIAGVHGLFFFSFMIFTLFSIIPLGAGIITVPTGIAMVLLGNVWGGLFLIAWHLIAVTNIDNILRPRLVPKEAKLNSALMLLAVFAGLIHFGFLGIVLGPVLMIVLVTTIQVFLSAYHNVAMQTAEPDKPGLVSGLRKLFQRITHRS